MKKSILIFVASYLPAFKAGGPVRTIANLVDHLGEKLHFLIVTRDRDSFDAKSYPNVKVNCWNTVGQASVFYASPAFMGFFNIVRLLRHTSFDVLYLNSFFAFKFTVLPLLARWLRLIPEMPVILAPRGEFSREALKLKTYRKMLYLVLTRWLGFYRGIVWQASSEYEAMDIRRVLRVSDLNIRVATDLPAVPTSDCYDQRVTSSEYKVDGSLRVVFLSRVSPMKNLDFALRALALVDIPLRFDIFGLVDDQEYWRRCQDQIEALPDHVTVEYRGIAQHEQVFDVISEYDLFFLPTRGENYGHAIHEALAAGTPVLISDQTPWRDLEEADVGWVRSLDDLNEFVSVINGLAKQSGVERLARRTRAYAYAVRVGSNAEAVERNLALFVDAIDKGITR